MASSIREELRLYGHPNSAYFDWNQLAQRGITVEYIDFTISRSFGASFRCSTQPLVREDLS